MLRKPRSEMVGKGVAGTGDAYRRSRVQEKSLAKKMGATLTKGSGNQKEKGDLRKKGLFRIECKSTQQKSFSLTRETYYKIAAAAASASEIPAMIIEFLNDRGGVECELAIIPVDDLLRLLKSDDNE